MKCFSNFLRTNMMLRVPYNKTLCTCITLRNTSCFNKVSRFPVRERNLVTDA